MSALGSIDSKMYILKNIYTQATSYPIDVTSDQINGISLANNDDTTTLIIRVTYLDDTYLDIPVPPTKNFESLLDQIKTINTETASSSFNVAVYRRG